MRDLFDRVLRWFGVAVGCLIIGSCTFAGAMGGAGTAVLGLLSGCIVALLLLGWLLGYLLLRQDIASLKDAVQALQRPPPPDCGGASEGEGTQPPSMAAGPLTPGPRPTRINRWMAAALVAALGALITLAAWRQPSPPKPVATVKPPPSPCPAATGASDAAAALVPAERRSADARIVALVAEQIVIPTADVRSDSTLQSLQADSLDCVELVMALEDAFGIEIPEHDPILADGGRCVTVHQIARYVEKRVASRPAPRHAAAASDPVRRTGSTTAAGSSAAR